MNKIWVATVLFSLLSMTYCGTTVKRTSGDGDPNPIESRVATPYFTVDEGNYLSSIIVEVKTVTPQALIYCTTDGTEPSEISNLYTEPFVVDESVLISCRAYKYPMLPSDTAQAYYEIGSDGALSVAPLRFSRSSGIYADSIEVSVETDTPEASIYCTRNGVAPTEMSERYSGPITVSYPLVLLCRAYRSPLEPSPVAQGWYWINSGEADRRINKAWIEIRFAVDDVDKIRIRNGRMNIVHLSGLEPTSPLVDVNEFQGGMRTMDWDLNPWAQEDGINCNFQGNLCVSKALDLGLGEGTGLITPWSLNPNNWWARGNVYLNGNNELVIHDHQPEWSLYVVNFEYWYSISN